MDLLWLGLDNTLEKQVIQNVKCLSHKLTVCTAETAQAHRVKVLQNNDNKHTIVRLKER